MALFRLSGRNKMPLCICLFLPDKYACLINMFCSYKETLSRLPGKVFACDVAALGVAQERAKIIEYILQAQMLHFCSMYSFPAKRKSHIFIQESLSTIEMYVNGKKFSSHMNVGPFRNVYHFHMNCP